jgi:hypothetical protein
MKKKTFEIFINTAIESGKKEKRIYDNGLDLINIIDDYLKIINILSSSIYGVDVSDIIHDYIFDSIYGVLEINKENYVIRNLENEILADCSTLDGLYEYAEKTRLELINNKFNYEMKDPLSEEERDNILKNIFKMK